MRKTLLLYFFALVAMNGAVVTVSSPSSEWIPVSTSSGNNTDYHDDQQTGIPEADIVGTRNPPDATTVPGFYRAFNDNGTGSDTDGTLLFRVRLGSDNPDSGASGEFENYLFIGFDAGNPLDPLAGPDGALDIFIGVDGKIGNVNRIYDAGAGANISPSTTSLAVPLDPTLPEVNSWAHNTGNLPDFDNFDFSVVTSIDAGGPADLDGTGPGEMSAGDTPDFFLSIAIPFAALVSEMSRIAGITISDASAMRLVLGTSTQDNALNQDLGGVNGGVNSTTTWTDLGAFSDPISMNPNAPPLNGVPEPATFTLIGCGLLIIAAVKRQRSSRRGAQQPASRATR